MINHFPQNLLDYYSIDTKATTDYIGHCFLKWRQNKLLVCRPDSEAGPLPSFKSKPWLIACLKRSPVRLIWLDPELEPLQLERWVEVGHQANKSLFLRLSAIPQNFRQPRSPDWKVKRLIDRSVAMLLLVLLSPLMLVLMALMLIQSPGPVLTRHWCVGRRGRLFQLLTFRTTVSGPVSDRDNLSAAIAPDRETLESAKAKAQSIPIGQWMKRYGLHKLPQLINVLQGEMTIVGTYPWLLEETTQLNSSERQQFNVLPGITGPWRLYKKARRQNLHILWRCNVDYLQNWSLLTDFKILLLTVPNLLLSYEVQS